MITPTFPMALSIRQPWAWLIITGHKPVENRDWPTPFRGRVLIHAGLNHDPDLILSREEIAELSAAEIAARPAVPKGRKHHLTAWDWPHITPPPHFDYGGIVGEAEIVDCVTSHPSPFFTGPYGFVLRGGRPLPFTPYKGRLGFFEVQLPL